MYKVKKPRELLIKISLIAVIAFLVFSYFIFDFIKEPFNILIISYILASILNPLKESISKVRYFNKRSASIMLIILLIIILFLAIFAIIPSVFKEFNNVGDVIEKLKIYINNFEKSDTYNESFILKYIYSEGKLKLVSLFENVTINTINFLISLSDKLISYFVVPVVTYYLLVDKEKIGKKVMKLIPIKRRDILKKIIYDCNRLLGSYLIGQIFLSFLISIITLVGLIVFDIKFPLGLSLLNGILNIIPYFGPIFGAVPIVIVAFIESTSKGIWISIFLLVIQQIEGNIVSPKITGDTTDMHPLVIIILLLIGEKIGGFIGMIIVIPISVIIKVIYEDINSYIY